MMQDGTSRVEPVARRGRAAISNAAGRFERFRSEGVDDGWDYGREACPAPTRTEFLIDSSRSVIARNTSPDLPFDRSINAYRGCEHGCIYCFARPTHAFLGMSPGIDFESRILVKPDAAEILKRELNRPGYRPASIAMGTNTDPYQPAEKRFEITRRILEVLLECRHPVSIVTKSASIVRDIDILSEMAKEGLVKTAISVTTLDRSLARKMEPRASTPARRLDAIWSLSEAEVPVGVMVAPVVPGLTDWEMDRILKAAARSGASGAGYILLRLPGEVRDLFIEWLREAVPERADRVMSLIRAMRGGRDNDPRFGSRMKGCGPLADLLDRRFHVNCKRLGLDTANTESDPAPADCSRFRAPASLEDRQLKLF